MKTFRVEAQNGVKNLAIGRSWNKGQAIGPAGFPPQLWKALLKERAVVEVKRQAKKKPKTPQDNAEETPQVEVESDDS